MQLQGDVGVYLKQSGLSTPESPGPWELRNAHGGICTVLLLGAEKAGLHLSCLRFCLC
jgi:hypothetical protein